MKIERPSSGTIGRIKSRVGIFQRCFNFATELLIKQNDQKRKSLKKQNGSNAEYHLTLKQVDKIINACRSDRDKVLIQILAFTGIRRAEAASLTVEDIRWDERLLTIRNGKGHKQRLVPAPDFVLENLKSLVGHRNSGAVFEGRSGYALSCRQLNRIVAKIGTKAGVNNPNPKYKYITCHLFRHTFARLWKDKEGSIESLSRILGHNSIKTTWDLYGSESMEDVRRNYDRTIKKLSP